MDISKSVLTVDEVARELRISKNLVYRQLKAGTIPSIRLGSKWLIPVKQLEAKLEGK